MLREREKDVFLKTTPGLKLRRKVDKVAIY